MKNIDKKKQRALKALGDLLKCAKYMNKQSLIIADLIEEKLSKEKVGTIMDCNANPDKETIMKGWKKLQEMLSRDK